MTQKSERKQLTVKDLKHVCIIGPGFIGGSIGLGLQAAGFRGHIFGLALDPSDVEAAIEAGAIHDGATRCEDLPAGIRLVCLATPISAMPGILRQLGQRLTDARVVFTDVGAVKGPIVDAAASLLPHPCNFVGGHPMTGLRHRGVGFARADLFHGATVILTPVSATRPQAVQVVRSLWELVGGHVIEMSPAAHDEVVARVSHLPHVVAALLLLEAARDEGLRVAAPGLLDVTRPAARDASLWQDILLANRTEVATAIGGLIDRLRQLSLWLERREKENLAELLSRAARIRAGWVAERFEQGEWID